MKKNNDKKTTEKVPGVIAAFGTMYDDYLSVKQKKQAAAMDEVAMMDATPHGGSVTDADQWRTIKESPTVADGAPAPAAAWQVPRQTQAAYISTHLEPSLHCDPPAGNVKAFRSKKKATERGFVDPDYRSSAIGGLGRNPKCGVTTNYMEPAVRTEMEDAQVLPELEDSEAVLPSDIEQFDEVRTAIRIVRQPERTLVYCIVVDKKDEKNVVAGLRCYGGVAFGGYARDVSGDAYLVECVQAVHLGSIPFSFRLEMPKSGTWNVDIPVPEVVLESAFAPAQRKTLSDLRERFPDDRFEFQYLQMLMAN